MPDRPIRAVLAALDEVFAEYRPIDFSVRLWQGETWPAAPSGAPRFVLTIHRPGALKRAFLSRGDLGLCEAFVHGDITVEGDLNGIFLLRDYLETLAVTPRRLARLSWAWLQLESAGPNRLDGRRPPARLTGWRHSIDRDRQAIRYHYDVSNEFYALWLDERMVYSCGYFPTGQEDLDTAQERKLDYICRKLRLGSGERLLDIGCGWGGLVIYAAQHYGARAVGITLSSQQYALAQERIRKAGLEGRCAVELCDYREIDAEPFDKLVSVGMFEHVGESQLARYFAKAFQSVKPGGLFLNHGIGGPAAMKRRLRSRFIDAYVFPDGELCDIGTVLRAAELAGFEVTDVESLRRHYGLTLRAWVSRLEANRVLALRHVDEVTYRVWQLYMSGAAYYFDTGRLNLYQSLLWKPTADGRLVAPWSRAHLYAGEASVQDPAARTE
jgi:cyclopropane-fatty-acyl-phospholipid synthase